MVKSIFVTLFILLLFLPFCLAQNKATVAILDLQANGVSQSEAVSITNRVRTELFLNGQYTIVEREMMEEILKEQNFQISGCTSSECIVQAGRILGVQKMVAGSVDKLGLLYSINLRMINVETGNIEALARADCQCTIEEVAVKSSKEAVQRLLTGKPQKITYIGPDKHDLNHIYLPEHASTLGAKKVMLRFCGSRAMIDRYDSDHSDWEQFDGYVSVDYKLFIGYGLYERWDLIVQLVDYRMRNYHPGGFYSGWGANSVQIGYGIVPWSIDKSGMKVSAGLRVSSDNPSIGSNGITDFLLNAVYSTKWFGRARINLGLNYLNSGKNEDDINIGDSFKIQTTLDYKLSSKFLALATLSYYSKKEDKSDTWGTLWETDRQRFNLNLELLFRLSNRVAIRPGGEIFLLGFGGERAGGTPYIDIFYNF